MTAHEAFARKYRPQTFDEVLAQPQVTRTLTNAITAGRLHHAYLFCGPRGTGKTTTARVLAKALNCEQGPTPTPCNTCASCVGVTNGSNIDVIEIDAASQTGVDDIRELRESSQYVPAGSRFKIYIIDEVHRLSPNAFDALLKTLEEPPPSVKFIFATTEPHKVPATVRSRTLRFDFRLWSRTELRSHLAFVAKSEGLTIDDASLDILAAEANGSVRDSQSLLEQIASFADGPITADITEDALGLVSSEILFAFTDAVVNADPAATTKVISDVSHSGRDVGQFVLQLNEHSKRLMFARALGDKFSDDALDEEGEQRYRTAAGALPENDWLRLLLMSLETGHRLRQSAQPYLEAEMFAMRVARMDRSIDIKKLVSRIEGGGISNSNNPVFAHSDKPSSPVANTTNQTTAKANPATNARSPSQPLPKVTGDTVVEQNQEEAEPITPSNTSPTPESQAGNGQINFAPILKAICSTRPMLQAILGHAVLTRSGAGKVELNVYHGSTFHQRQLGHKSVKDLIHAEIAKALGEGIRVQVHVTNGPPPAASVSAETGENGNTKNGTASDVSPGHKPNSDDDHLVQEIIRQFDGEIVNGVR